MAKGECIQLGSSDSPHYITIRYIAGGVGGSRVGHDVPF